MLFLNIEFSIFVLVAISIYINPDLSAILFSEIILYNDIERNFSKYIAPPIYTDLFSIKDESDMFKRYPTLAIIQPPWDSAKLYFIVVLVM